MVDRWSDSQTFTAERHTEYGRREAVVLQGRLQPADRELGVPRRQVSSHSVAQQGHQVPFQGRHLGGWGAGGLHDHALPRQRLQGSKFKFRVANAFAASQCYWICHISRATGSSCTAVISGILTAALPAVQLGLAQHSACSSIFTAADAADTHVHRVIVQVPQLAGSEGGEVRLTEGEVGAPKGWAPGERPQHVAPPVRCLVKVAHRRCLRTVRQRQRRITCKCALAWACRWRITASSVALPNGWCNAPAQLQRGPSGSA